MAPPASAPTVPRLAVRAVIVHRDRLLLVNAWKGRTHLLCAPGGGVEPHASLPDNLRREVHEECGLEIEVGPVCLVNEFHEPGRAFHQIEVFFRCRLISGDPGGDWTDPEGIVTYRRWLTAAELEDVSFRPAALARVAWDESAAAAYDPLERLLR